MMLPDDVHDQRLLDLTREAYDAVLGALPTWRAHCYEVSALGYAVARALDVDHAVLCRGSRRLPDDVHDQHGWLELTDHILHSPARGVVELVERDDDIFRWSWRSGDR